MSKSRITRQCGSPDASLIERVRKGLEQAGVLRRADEMVMADVKDLHYAYVLFDRYRGRAVKELLAELERRGISSVGRYGLWEHTSMEDAIAQGQQIAARLADESRGLSAGESMQVICHVITKLELGGAQEVAMHVVAGLDRNRFRPVLVAGPGGLLTEEARALEGVDVRIVPSLLREIHPLKDLRAFWELIWSVPAPASKYCTHP